VEHRRSVAHADPAVARRRHRPSTGRSGEQAQSHRARQGEAQSRHGDGVDESAEDGRWSTHRDEQCEHRDEQDVPGCDDRHDAQSRGRGDHRSVALQVRAERFEVGQGQGREDRSGQRDEGCG
jgi:hypothetical protein